jgi:hypothetical protein
VKAGCGKQLAESECHEALAPFRREVDQSGISDQELRVFFEEVREEIWQAKHGKPNDSRFTAPNEVH